MTEPSFVPDDFEPPVALDGPGFRLEPLTGEHNARDHAAWSGSMEHIHRTPGFQQGNWPHEMTLDQNMADLIRHDKDFQARRGFTYTVLDPDDDVVGCVYIYPLAGDPSAANVSSWVTEARADLDAPLYHAVSEWLERDWPFPRVEYGARD
ncbi:MAG TPA: hypothetical protein VM785_11590 [Gaiellales bacterium]|nr:hypothetical protein [Gaiellales bacterium]